MDDHEPWWGNDPELAAIRRGVEEELECARHEPIKPDVSDPVLADVYSDAVRKARAAGLSWGEIGRVLGVSKQLLHRRFSRPAPPAAP